MELQHSTRSHPRAGGHSWLRRLERDSPAALPQFESDVSERRTESRPSLPGFVADKPNPARGSPPEHYQPRRNGQLELQRALGDRDQAAEQGFSIQRFIHLLEVD